MQIIAVVATPNNYQWFMQSLPPGGEQTFKDAGIVFKPVSCIGSSRGVAPVLYTNILGHEIPDYMEITEYFNSLGAEPVLHTKIINLPSHMIINLINDKKCTP